MDKEAWISFERRGSEIHAGADWDLVVYGDGTQVWLDDGLPLERPDRELLEKVPVEFVEAMGLREQLEHEVGNVWSRERSIDEDIAIQAEVGQEMSEEMAAALGRETEREAQARLQEELFEAASLEPESSVLEMSPAVDAQEAKQADKDDEPVMRWAVSVSSWDSYTQLSDDRERMIREEQEELKRRSDRSDGFEPSM